MNENFHIYWTAGTKTRSEAVLEAGRPTRTSASPTAGQIPMLVALAAIGFFLLKAFYFA